MAIPTTSADPIDLLGFVSNKPPRPTMITLPESDDPETLERLAATLERGAAWLRERAQDRRAVGSHSRAVGVKS